MIKWQQADTNDKALLKILTILFEKNEHLLKVFLHPDLPKLSSTSDTIKSRMSGFSSGDRLLIRIGLDIWNGSGGIHFNELYETLDTINLKKILVALIGLHNAQIN